MTAPNLDDIARHGLRKYLVAAEAGMHPSYLAQALHGQTPMTPELSRRIRGAIDRLGLSRGQA